MESEDASTPSHDSTMIVSEEKKVRSKGWSDSDSLLLIKAWAHIDATKRCISVYFIIELKIVEEAIGLQNK